MVKTEREIKEIISAFKKEKWGMHFTAPSTTGCVHPENRIPD